METSFNGIAFVNSTRKVIVTIDWGIYTKSSFNVTRIGGTSVIVVTGYCGVGTNGVTISGYVIEGTGIMIVTIKNGIRRH